MIYLILVFALLHVSFFLALGIGWKSIKEHSSLAKDRGISIILPVRNEEENISRILTCLAHQDYPKERFEILVIDDFSEDGTVNKISDCLPALQANIKLIQLKELEKSGKKNAITKGVEASKFEYIITTDADCYMGPLWLGSYAKAFEDNVFVAGPVNIKGRGFFALLQQVEFAGLMGFGAVTLVHDNPSMCSGANLGFSKKAFQQVGGYENNIRIATGDDEFLLYSIQSHYPGKATFLKNRLAIVLTPAHLSFRAFINQRIRWTSKWKHNKNPRLRGTTILFFIDHLTMFLLMYGFLRGEIHYLMMLSIYLVRLFAEFLFVQSVGRFSGHKSVLLPLLLLQIIYPIHVLFMGVNSIFGNYTWKGRRY